MSASKKGTVLYYVVGAGWVVYMLLLGSLYTEIPMSPDQATFAYIGAQLAEGNIIYSEVGEQNWPGAMWLHFLAVSLFGAQPSSWRLLELILVVAASFPLVTLLPRRRLSWILAPWLVPLAYTTAGVWQAGQRDIVAGYLLVGSGAAFAQRLRGGPFFLVVPVAALLFLAVATRPTFALFGGCLLVGALLLIRGPGALQRLALDGAGALGAFGALLVLTLVWASATGSLDAFVSMALRFNTQVYVESSFNVDFLWVWLTDRALYLLVGVFGAAAWLRSKEHPEGAFVLASIGLTTAVSYVVMGKGFGYHLGGFHPVVMGLALHGLSEAWERLSSPRSAVLASGLSLAILLQTAQNARANILVPLRGQLGLLSESELRQKFATTEIEAVSERISALGRPGDTVLTLSRLVIVNVLTHRPLPFRWATTGMLEYPAERFEDYTAWQDEAVQALETAPPRFIVAARDEGRLTQWEDPEGRVSPYSRWVREALEDGRYVLVETFSSPTREGKVLELWQSTEGSSSH